jgi:hypothetical protein
VIFVVIVNFPTGVGVSAADAGAASAKATAGAAARNVRGLLIGVLSPVLQGAEWTLRPLAVPWI